MTCPGVTPRRTLSSSSASAAAPTATSTRYGPEGGTARFGSVRLGGRPALGIDLYTCGRVCWAPGQLRVWAFRQVPELRPIAAGAGSGGCVQGCRSPGPVRVLRRGRHLCVPQVVRLSPELP